MAESTVVIKIEIVADDREITRVQRRLAALAAQGQATSSRFDDMTDSSDRFDKSLKRNSGSIDRFNNKANTMRKTLSKVGDVFSKVAHFGIKAFAVSLGAAVVTILAANAAFWAGRVAVKAYHATLTGLAAAGASVVTVLTALAAGQREWNAALAASRYGGNMKETMAQLRGVTSNTRLAVLGAEALTNAFVSLSKNAKMTGPLNQALTAMGDFAVASGDPTKALAAAGDFLGQLQKSGKLTKEVQAAGAAVGPQFVEAMKKAIKSGNTSSSDFLSALIGGDLSGGVAGSLDTLNNTLFGTARKYFQVIKEDFADFGQSFLPEFTSALSRVARSLRASFLAISGPLAAFVRGSFIDGFVGAIDKFAKWSVMMFTEYLPKAEGMITRIKDGFGEIGDWFENFRKTIEPLKQGARVLMDAFGPVIKQMLGGFGSGIMSLNDLLVNNRDALMDTGESLRNLAESVGELFGKMREALIRALPVINRIVDAFSSLVDIVGSLLGFTANFGKLSPLASLLGIAGIGFGGSLLKTAATGRGGLASRMMGRGGLAGGAGQVASTVNMNAGVVYLNGSIAGGAGGVGRFGAGINAFGGVGASAYGPQSPGASKWRNRLGGAMGGPASGLLGTMLAFGLPVAGAMFPGVPGAQMAGFMGGGAMMAAQASGKSVGTGMAWAAPAMAAGIAGSMGQEWLYGNRGTGKHASATGHTIMSGMIGAGIGAGAGAATGAAIGAFGGPIGAGAGAIIGLFAGGIAGVVMSGKQKKQARKIAEQYVGNYDEEISAYLEKGDVVSAKAAFARMEEQSGIQAEATKQVDSFNKKYEELQTELERKMMPALHNFDENLAMLSTSTGLTGDKIKVLADELGINLTEAIDVAAAAAQILGTVDWSKLSPEGFLAQTGQIGISSALGVFDKPAQEKAAIEAVSQSGRLIEQNIAAGMETPLDQVGQFLKDAMGLELQRNGGDFGEAMLNMLNKTSNAGEGMFGEGFQFEGGSETLRQSMIDMLGESMKTYINDATDPITATFTRLQQESIKNTGGQFTFNADAASSTFKTELREMINSGNAEGAGEMLKALQDIAIGAQNKDSYTEFFGSVGLNYRTAENLSPEHGVNAGDWVFIQDYTRDGVKTGVYEGFVEASGVIKLALEKANLNVNVTVSGGGGGRLLVSDTMTPRFGDTSSNLADTMGRHGKIDSMLSGKRKVTSSFRDWGLGSINSDHVTGRAYDLTGQNLGMYKTIVERDGGFAEYHGGAINRHLHVVPGEGVGDSMMPKPNSMSPSSAGMSVQEGPTIIQVHGGRDSAEQIAQQVAIILDKRDKNRAERMNKASS